MLHLEFFLQKSQFASLKGLVLDELATTAKNSAHHCAMNDLYVLGLLV